METGVMQIDKNSIIENIAFAEHILNYYDWDSTEIKEIENELSKVKGKINDENLYLSVVGEFSSGKSTFINALLRDDLLEANVVQGTTISNTIIRYAPEYNIIVNSATGEMINLSKELKGKGVFGFMKKLFGGGTTSAEERKRLLKEYIKDVTTTEKYSGEAKEIIIEHPAEILKNGIVIIDTPGTNSVDQWHEDVTKEAIGDISDASLIVLNGSKPLEKTFVDFICENLKDVLPNSLFIMTKMDMLRERERERQIKYVEQTIEQNFNLERTIVLPYTPLFVLGEAIPEVKAEYNYDKPDYESLVSDSYSSEEKIVSYIREHKIQMQHAKTMGILKQILWELSTRMDTLNEEYQSQHEILETHAKKNLEDFSNEMLDKYLESYNGKAKQFFEQLSNQVSAICDKQKNKTYQTFSSCSSRKEVENFCKYLLPQKLESDIKEIADYTIRESKQLEKAEERVLSEFWSDFEATYNELKALEVKTLDNSHREEKGISLSNRAEFISIGKDLKNIEGERSALQIGAAIGGAYIGAAIGSAILPGIGTGVGIAVGKFIDGLFAPSLESIKERAWNQVAPSIDNAYENAFSSLWENLGDYDVEIQNHINEQIGNCVNEYGELVATLIKRDEIEKHNLDLKIKELQSDKDNINAKLCVELDSYC